MKELLRRATSESKEEKSVLSHDTSVRKYVLVYQDQENICTDGQMGDGEVNATNPNTTIEDTMAPSLSAR